MAPTDNTNNVDNLITLATCYDPFKAEIIKTRLEAEGIKCFVQDGNLVPSSSFFSDDGGVKIKVSSIDQAMALEILRTIQI